MRETTKVKFEFMKSILEEDPFNLVFGDIQEATEPKVEVEEGFLRDYESLLNEYESIRCGVVTLFGRSELDQFQFPVAEMSGTYETWICIGKIEPDPLFINKTNGQICCLVGHPGSEQHIKCYGELFDFLDDYVLGGKYIELGGKDEWYEWMSSRI